MSKNQNISLCAVVLLCIVSVMGIWMSRGYGEVSPQTYEFSKAIYSACLTKNEAHLAKVEELLASNESEGLPADERNWLEGIVAKARDGDWEAAATNARRMMEDQVQY